MKQSTDEIAHYTTEGGLFEILKSKKLWATHYKYLTDISESEHGENIINELYNATAVEVGRKRIGNPNDLIVTPNKQALNFLWNIGIGNPYQKEHSYFITSFSAHTGNDGILSQWRSYGNNGGFALVFSKEELKKSYDFFAKNCKEHTNKNNNCEECSISIHRHFLEDVAYALNLCDIENEFYRKNEFYAQKISIIKEIAPIIIEAQMVFWENKNTLQRNDALLKIGEERWDLYHEALLALKLMVKHPGFSEEQEIRFGCVNIIEGLNNSCHKSVIKNGAPRLEIDFYPNAIKKIIIGPQDRQHLKKNLVRHLLDEVSVGGIEIVESSLPDRQIR